MVKTTGPDDENTRAITMRGLKRPRKIKEEEAAKENLEEVQDRKQQLEDEVWKEVEQYIFSLEQKRRMSSFSNAKIWQVAQSSATKAENLENDFIEATAKVQELGWKEGKISPSAGWHRTMAMAREVSQGMTSIRGVSW